MNGYRDGSISILNIQHIDCNDKYRGKDPKVIFSSLPEQKVNSIGGIALVGKSLLEIPRSVQFRESRLMI